MKPLTTWRIAMNNLKGKPFRAVGLAMAVAAFSFALFGGTLLSESVGNGVDSMARRLGADILVVPHGYDKKLQAALLRGEPSTFFIKGDLADKLRELPGVAKVAPQLYLATLKTTCCTVPVQVIAYDPDSDFVVGPWVASRTPRTPAGGEVVIGHMIVGEVGGALSLFGRSFTIAGRLDRTGMGFDTTVFMTMDNARSLLRRVGNDAVAFEPGSVSSLMVALSPGRDLKETANAILGRFALDYNLDIVVSKNMISDIAKRLGGMASLVHAAAGIFWLAATGVLFLFFSLMLNERRREFGVLRLLGATRARLARIVLCEALAISLAGGVLGIAAAAALAPALHRRAALSLELPYMAAPLSTAVAVAAAGLFLATATGLLASLYAAWRIGTGDAYLTMREGE